MPPTFPRTPRVHPPRRAASHRAGAGRDAESLLGAGHPLVAVLYACEATIEGIVAVAAVELGALALWLVDASSALALTVGAGLVQLALGLRLAALRTERRDLCLELVVAGRDRLPISALIRECRRLADPRRQAQLARSLEEFADIAVRHPRRERQRPIYSRRVLAAVEPELRDIAARLRIGEADLRGVALLYRLVTCGASPLYGEHAGPLREELIRGRYLLSVKS